MKQKYGLVLIFALYLLAGCSSESSKSQKAGAFISLFDGKTLDNWIVPAGDNGHWKVVDGIIDYDGKSEAQGDKNLWSKKEYGDFVLKVDWRFSGPPHKEKVPLILPDGTTPKNPDGSDQKVEIDYPGDSGIYLRGNSKSQVNIWNWPIGSGEVYGYRMDKKMSPEVRKGVTPIKRADKPIGEWNSFVITMKGDRLTVVLNGETVIKNAQLPGVPKTGKIALQHHGDPIQFRNIFIKEL